MCLDWVLTLFLKILNFVYFLNIYVYLLFKEMGIPEHVTCLLRNLYAGQEATFGTGHGTMDWFQTGKGAHQGCIVTLLI